MLTWLSANLGTILITAGLVILLALAVLSLIRDRKKGKTGCGCGCAHCAMHGACHKK